VARALLRAASRLFSTPRCRHECRHGRLKPRHAVANNRHSACRTTLGNMIIGVPREVKDHETRVGLVPSAVIALQEAGHQVLVEVGAGVGSSLPDRDYKEAGRDAGSIGRRGLGAGRAGH